MAIIQVDYSETSNSNLRAVFNSGANYLPAAGGALEPHSGTHADYEVSAATEVVFVTSLMSRYTFTVPTPSVLPVTLNVSIYDKVTGANAGSGQIRLDSSGDEVVDARLGASGLDAILVESGITPGAGLVNDTGTQLANINARQALSAALSALAAQLSGAGTGTEAIKAAGKSATTRITATVDASGNRSAVNLKVPD